MNVREVIIMKKVNIIITVVVTLFILSGYSYYSFRYNDAIYSYDFTTLKNVCFTLNDIIDVYGAGNYDEALLKEYCDQMETLASYAQQSPHINVISFTLSRISRFEYENLSKEELDYLISVRDKLKEFNDKINLEYRGISIKRILGVFRKPKINELKTIFNDFPL